MSNSNLLVLIIEDDFQLGQIFSLALQDSFEIEIITDGEVAQTRLTEIAPAVIVLDLKLPHISGASLLKQIRADKRLAKTKVIVATADPNQAPGVYDEADVVIVKPVNPIQLREQVISLHNTP